MAAQKNRPAGDGATGQESKTRVSLPDHGIDRHLERVRAGEQPTSEAALLAAGIFWTSGDQLDVDATIAAIDEAFEGAGFAVDRQAVGAVLRGEVRLDRDDRPRDGDPVVRMMSNVEPRDVDWLWPRRIARGKLTLIAGHPGLGKSLVTLDMAARVSTGAGWPDSPQARCEPAGVIILSAEDDCEDTIRPRLDAAGADCTRIAAIEAVQMATDHGLEQVPFSIATDLAALEHAIHSVPEPALVIIDPVSAYIGRGVDDHRNAELRAVLHPLSRLASRAGVAIVCVSHLAKAQSAAAVLRPSGSIAYTAACRAVYLVVKDPEDGSGRRRIMAPGKNNLGNDIEGFAYVVQDAGRAPALLWEPDPVEIDLDEIFRAGRPGPDPFRRGQAEDFLREALRRPRPSEEVKALAKQAGINDRTLRRAKLALNVRSQKVQGSATGSWYWALPPPNR